MSIKIRDRLPKGDADGLASWEAALAKDPNRVVPVVALLQTDTIEARPHNDEDPRQVKCILLGLEVLDGKSAEGKTVDGLLHQVHEARTGKASLPFEDGDQ